MPLILLFPIIISITEQKMNEVVRKKKVGLPFPFANVFGITTTNNLVTEVQGKFTFSGDFPMKIEMLAFFIGYVPKLKAISFSGNCQVNVILKLAF